MIVDVWDQSDVDIWRTYGVPNTLKRGYNVVVSSGCYFLEFPPPWAKASPIWTWRDNYMCDVQNVSGLSPQDAVRILGGENLRRLHSTTDIRCVAGWDAGMV